MHQHIKKLIYLLPIALLLLTIQPASAQLKSFYWKQFDVDITLLENGDMRFVETQTIVFSGDPFTFGFATIPTGGNGNNDAISNIAVSENGVPFTESRSEQPGTFKLTDSSDEIRIDWYFEPSLGEHTYVFTYIVQGGIIVGTSEEGDGDQIFWKAIPADIPGAVHASRVTIHLPEGIRPQQYTGTTDYLAEGTLNGRSEDVITQVTTDARTIIYDLQPWMTTGDLFEVRVQFPHGILDIPVPDWQKQQQNEDVYNLIAIVIALLFLLVGPLGVFMLWYTKGRDPQLTFAVPEYITEPPSNIPPAIAGTLIDEKADMRDIISTIIDLAARGYLIITEEKKNHIFSNTMKDSGGLRPFEKQFIKDIFRGQQDRSLTDLRYKFADKLPRLRKMLYQELVDNEFTPQSPETVRNRYTALGVMVIVASGGLFFILPAFAPSAICIAIALGISGVALLISARAMPAKTAKGTEEAAKWEAFKNYLQRIEEHDDLEQASDIFEKYLGYATAFGLERSWIRKFSKVSTTPHPPWYYPHPYSIPRGGSYGGTIGRGQGNMPSGEMPTLEGMSGGLTGGLENMSKGLTRMLNSSNTIMKSVKPSNNTSSGNFSGGFSGGGSFSSGGGGSRGFG